MEKNALRNYDGKQEALFFYCNQQRILFHAEWVLQSTEKESVGFCLRIDF